MSEAPTSGTEQRRPILEYVPRLHEYPRERCPDDIRRILEAAFRGHRGLAVAFECYLQVTRQSLPHRWARPAFLKLVPEFLGALHSEKFAGRAPTAQYTWTRAVHRAATAAGANLSDLLPLKPRAFETSDILKSLASSFDAAELDLVAVEYWSGWPVYSAGGHEYWLPLGPVFKKFGAEWTRQFHDFTEAWFAGLRATRLPGLREFSAFIQAGAATKEQLLNRFEVGRVWREFWDFYARERGKTTSTTVLIDDWRNHWRDFAHEGLPDSGLFAKSSLGFPGPEAGGTIRRYSHPRERPLGTLLSEVPRTASDRQALEALVSAIPRSLAHVNAWATAECEDLFRRYTRRRALARAWRQGTETDIVAGSKELAKHAHMYELHGHKTMHQISFYRFFPRPLGTLAHELGVPATGSLLPFAALLVMNHPEITPSFLENLDLFNKRGKLSGLRSIGGGTYLIGWKYRKGKKAVQRVRLNAVTLRVVRRLLLITQSARRCLHQAADDGWRALFLCTGRGFAPPSPVKRFASDTSGATRIPVLVKQFEARCGLDSEAAGKFVARFSLRSLRSTVGVNIFIATHSEEVMAAKLGHERFLPTLLAKYLPASLLAYFRERWVAAFQTHLAIYVSAGTGLELRATGFSSREKMELFLENNAFPKLPLLLRREGADSIELPEGSFYFNANETTLTFLCVVAADANRTNYWVEFGSHMLANLEARRGMDPALDECLIRARANARSWNDGERE